MIWLIIWSSLKLPWPDSRTILSTIYFSKAFDSVWHPARLAFLEICLAFLESNFILSLRQAGFRPGRSTLDQILYLSQSISDGFNKPRPGSRTILSTIDFSKAFEQTCFGWPLSLFCSLDSIFPF